jgi:hypothetical protein
LLPTFLLNGGSLQVECEQVLKYLFVREMGRPSVGREDRLIEPGVRALEPRRALLVEVRERSLLEFGFGSSLRIEPVAAQLV